MERQQALGRQAAPRHHEGDDAYEAEQNRGRDPQRNHGSSFHGRRSITGPQSVHPARVEDMYYTVPNQGGRRYIVTDANSGTGREAARRMTIAGAEVVLAVRSPDKGEEAKAAILREAPDATLDVRRLDPVSYTHLTLPT